MFILFSLSWNFLEAKRAAHFSSYPFISDQTFACICDHECTVRSIKAGDIIYCDNSNIGKFFTYYHPHISAPYILVSHGSCNSVPGKYAMYLNSPKLIAWFAKNIDRDHPKLFPLPIGLANKGVPQGNMTTVVNAIKKIIPPLQRSNDKLVYVNIHVASNPKERNKALHALKSKAFCFFGEKKPFPNYLNELAQFKFAVSPNGAGIDCHRTWEALLMQTIPIVTRSSICKLFEDLPVLIVDDWQEITDEFLTKKFIELAQKSYNQSKLYADYWIQQIQDVQKQYKKNRPH